MKLRTILVVSMLSIGLIGCSDHGQDTAGPSFPFPGGGGGGTPTTPNDPGALRPGIAGIDPTLESGHDTELLGKDADGNGVRDDVDRLVAKDIAAMPHAVSPHAKVSLQRLALFMSQALVADLNDPVLVRALAEDQQLAVACVGALWNNALGFDNEDYRPILAELESAILNTRKRYKADRAFWMATASMGIGDDYYSPCEEVPRNYPWPVPSWAAVKAEQTVQ